MYNYQRQRIDSIKSYGSKKAIEIEAIKLDCYDPTDAHDIKLAKRLGSAQGIITDLVEVIDGLEAELNKLKAHSHEKA